MILEQGHEGDDGGRTLECAPIWLAAYPGHPAALPRLQGFRAGLHACCLPRADALLDLADALLSAQGASRVAAAAAPGASPPARLGRTYAALACGRIDIQRLRDLLVRFRFLPDADPLVFAVDVTAWPRCDAECSPERGCARRP